ncbi:ABC-type multidrug transport system ATPase subunit [Allocatelliglobosispora scoriae]|uniref:ABC-type multidrug transport system ATPase subunit n=1 Tax=Allocatelliglobosispora scoriae TaxID=643052 RepID=A0A841C496_9ACTN|nr:ABC transporter ATP-binding protein [Allocatelliglobosispora scoriae]MBB5873963.1 ABC-type multidrug transport system ATPase subunit [Allocatelliglobosispora scoriae]
MRLDDIWLRYARGAPWVLQGVTAAIGPGETVVVAGRNGAGKSTLLQLIAGVLRADRGRVTERPRVVGWVPERFPLGVPGTVAAYLSAMGAIRGLAAPARAAAVDGWVERLGLGAFRDTPLGDLSKGTAQKVGLAQALLTPPELLILDEPWEGLDVATRDIVPEIVLEVAAAGGAVLISDHRGETARLPGATQWTVIDGRVTTAAAADQPRYVIEIEAAGDEVPAVVARLRADGLTIARVRQESTP